MKATIYPGLFLLLFPFLNCFATVHTITIENFQFSPSTINATVGDTVIWTRAADAVTHTTTSTSVPNGATPWDVTISVGNPSFSYVVTVPGTYAFHCSIHTSMTGTITAAELLSITPLAPGAEIRCCNFAPNQLSVGFDLKNAATIETRLLNINGQVLANLGNSAGNAGNNTILYNIGNMPAGIYIVCIELGGTQYTRKLFLK